jgi:TPR repeat protein
MRYAEGDGDGDGDGVEQDSRQAVDCYRRAAKQGLVDAQYNLGICYDQGIGVGMDTKQALAWFRKAAEQGNVGAQYYLGTCYANGDGVAQDYQQAVTRSRGILVCQSDRPFLGDYVEKVGFGFHGREVRVRD